MGQYFVVCNLDKKEFVHPHKLGSGLKLWEQLAAHPGTGAALIVLCASLPQERGGGDLAVNRASKKYIGRWAGDRIAIIGDYACPGDIPRVDASAIYQACMEDEWKDVSDGVCKVIERELGGKFEGEGWRDFVTKG